MGLGVIILVPIVMAKTGGLEAASKSMLQDTPTFAVTSIDGPFNDVVFRSDLTSGSVTYQLAKSADVPFGVQADVSGERADIVITVAVNAKGKPTSTANDLIAYLDANPIKHISIDNPLPYKNDRQEMVDGKLESKGADGVLKLEKGKPVRYAFVARNELLLGPGRKNTGQAFHPLGMIFSFFFIWSIVGIAQPGNMVRLMAFQDSRTLKRAILTVTIYFAIIYLPLVFIVMAARNSLPILTPEESDRTMVLNRDSIGRGYGAWLQDSRRDLYCGAFRSSHVDG